MALKVGELFATLNLDDSGFTSGLSGAKNSAMSAAADIAKSLGLVALGKSAFSAFTDFESAFAGVMKTVDETATTTYADLQNSIIAMSKELPASATEIAAVAEAAGQLGIGADSIMEFTRVMIDMGESTNLSATDAATTLAQFANVMGTSDGEFSNLGSTIVALGNSFATTEADIAAMAQRMAGAGAQVGMSEADVLGFAAALSSVGIESQAGGSAFSTFASNLSLAVSKGGKDLRKYAEVAGMSSKEFKQLFETDATGAILAFIDGLGKAEDGIGTLADLGISEINMSRALLAAAGASDMFADAVSTANRAYSENTALSAEAAKRYETVASRIAMLKNSVSEMARQFGEAMLPAFEAFLPIANSVINTITGFSEGTKQGILAVAAFIAAVGPAKLIFAGLCSAMTAAGGALAALVSPLGLTVGAFVLLYKNSARVRNAVSNVRKSFKVLFAALNHGIEPLDAVYKAIRAGFGTELADEVLPVLDSIGSAWDSTVNWLETTTAGMKAAFKGGKNAGGIFQGISDSAQVLWLRMKPLFQQGWNSLKTGAAKVGPKISGAVKTALESVKLKVSDYLTGIDWSGIWDSAVITSLGLWSKLVTAIQSVKITASNWLTGINWSGIWDNIGNTAESLKTKVGEMLGNLPGIIEGFVADAANFTSSGKFAQLGEQIVSLLSAGIRSKAGGGAASIINAVSGLFEGVSGNTIGANLKTALGNMGAVVVDAIVAGIGAVGDGATSLINAVGGLLKSALSEENLSATMTSLNSLGSAIIDAIVKALKAVTTEGSKIAGALSEVLGSIDFEDVGESIGTLASNLVSDLATKLTEDDGSSFGTALGTLLGKAAGGLLAACSGIVTTIVNNIITDEGWGPLGNAILALLRGALQFAWDGVKAFAIEIGRVIQDLITPKLTLDGFEISFDWVDAVEGLNKDEIVMAANGITQRVREMIDQGMSKEEIVAEIKKLKTKFGLTDSDIGMLDEAGYWMYLNDAINGYFSQNIITADVPVEPNVTNADGGSSDFSTVAQQIANAYTQNDTTVPVPLDLELGDTSTITAEVTTQLSTAGSTAGESFSGGVASGITTGSGTVDTAVSTMLTSITASMSTATATIRTSGLNFSRGLAAGIKAGKSTVINAAKEVAKAAIAAANKELKIGSPSRVMAKSGQWFDEGFAVGIVDSIRVVTGAASEMARMAAAAATVCNPGASVRTTYAAAGAGGGGAYIDYDRLADAVARRPVYVDLDGRKVGRIVYRAQNGNARSSAMGYGK